MKSAPMKDAPLKAACPICRKTARVEFRPFCSSRCANVDLQRWLSGSYVLPGDEGTSEGEADPSGPN